MKLKKAGYYEKRDKYGNVIYFQIGDKKEYVKFDIKTGKLEIRTKCIYSPVKFWEK